MSASRDLPEVHEESLGGRLPVDGLDGLNVGRDDVMLREDENSILQRDRANSTYELLLKKAVEDGRIGGPSRCRVCGMRYNNSEEAATCCEKVLQHNRL